MQASLTDLCAHKQIDLIAFLKELVECETPSGDVGAISRFAALLDAHISDIATLRTIDGHDGHG
ncbi:MAG TPA: hypothetical protein VES20_09910, partial [Bryobacteraceae bacterium]|nr:hypothetical protein [Bryobacteraceae bacterium]